MAGFEPAASTSQMWRDTGLRYIPKILLLAANIVFLLISAGHLTAPCGANALKKIIFLIVP
jgi:hypothetical protein